MTGRAAVLAACLLLPLVAAAAPPPGSPAARYEAMEQRYAALRDGGGSAPRPGVDATQPPVDVAADFHGSLDDPALVLYAAGNYFFAMDELVRRFGEAYPAYAGRVFYETLPPAMLIAQMDAGGTVTVGNLTFTARPDVMMAVQAASERWVAEGRLAAPVVPFATNDLAIMVPAGNPAAVTGLADLARPDLPIAMPEAAAGGIATQIRAALVKAGGRALDDAVYGAKVEDGTNVLMRIHHRETPLLLMAGGAAAGVTWTSEAVFAERAGYPIAHVSIPATQNVRATYSATAAKGAPHPEAASAWLGFMQSDIAFAVLAPFGFGRAGP